MILLKFQFGRWSLLSVGVLYGAYHHSRLTKKEAALRDIEAKKKDAREAQLAIEKKQRYDGLILIYIFCVF